MAQMSLQEKVERWKMLKELQAEFPYTVKGLCMFAQVVISTTINGSPNLNRVQADILRFLFTGSKYRLIMAARGMTKTVLTAIFAVFMLIHKPNYRVIVFSQNAKRAKEIAGWIIKIFSALDILHFMKPDKYAGDRSSIESFDIHYVFRGDDKSPSVACYSIESGAQGARADLIIADDVESLQNSRTQGGRTWLMEQTLEFESINQFGDIVYLGTPQSVDSIYNWLPSRGYDVRIWTGRYPSPDLLEFYGKKLAPMFLEDMQKNPGLMHGGGLDGSMGQATCPEMYDEDLLDEKELTLGKAKFMLQFMLNTGLQDANLYPLKLSDLIVANFNKNKAPEMPIWCNTPSACWNEAPKYGTRKCDQFYFLMQHTYDLVRFEQTVGYIDPAGGGKNGDETAYAIIKTIGVVIYVYDVDAVAGGYSEESMKALVHAMRFADCKKVYIENNYGNGAHVAALKPYFEREYPVTIEAVQESGQKELRIIDTIEPVMSTHRLVFRQEVIQKDFESIQKYSANEKLSFSLFHQMAFITREKNSLRHDDRLDALAGAIRQVVERLDYDQMKVVLRRQVEQQSRFHKVMSSANAYKEYMTNVTLGMAHDVALNINESFKVIGNRFSNTVQGKRKW